MLVALTNLWYLFRKTLEVGVLITPILMAVRVLVVELQKNNARPSLNGSDVGMKMKLHSFAIDGCSFEVYCALNPVAIYCFIPFENLVSSRLGIVGEKTKGK